MENRQEKATRRIVEITMNKYLEKIASGKLKKLKRFVKHDPAAPLAIGAVGLTALGIGHAVASKKKKKKAK
jgi:hypothetical protein